MLPLAIPFCAARWPAICVFGALFGLYELISRRTTPGTQAVFRPPSCDPRIIKLLEWKQRRIVSLISSATEMVNALGGLDLLYDPTNAIILASVRSLPACTKLSHRRGCG